MTKKAEDVEVVVVDTVARADTPGTVSETEMRKVLARAGEQRK